MGSRTGEYRCGRAAESIVRHETAIASSYYDGAEPTTRGSAVEDPKVVVGRRNPPRAGEGCRNPSSLNAVSSSGLGPPIRSAHSPRRRDSQATAPWIRSPNRPRIDRWGHGRPGAFEPIRRRGPRPDNRHRTDPAIAQHNTQETPHPRSTPCASSPSSPCSQPRPWPSSPSPPRYACGCGMGVAGSRMLLPPPARSLDNRIGLLLTCFVL